MNFLWSSFLYLLFLIPLIVAVYIWILRRRKRFAIRYSSLSLVREAVSKQSWLRRHLPFVLFLFALASLVLALARPVAEVAVPSNRATIILAMDVSRSMCSTDIDPNRLEAAKNAALSFVQNQVRGRRIGIVAFAGFAELVQPPTEDQSLLESAITNLTTARRTAIGSAILRSLDAIAEIDRNVMPSDTGNIPEGAFTPVPEGEYVPHIIVLLTDGASNAGPSPISAAQQASERGVRVYTIGFGTVNNSSPMNCGDQFQENDLFGGGFGPTFGGGGGFRREIDEETLTMIADMTGGTYHAATSAGELGNVFQNLPTYLVVTREITEVGAFFTAFAVLLAVIAMILSFLWHPLS
ncbi:MAG TPA: VWA domain-containing protein [Anaerolineales bacterium]|jgi:Ca-activated chloride channel homolog|nr:VWA domain-containing protein [Anaerolineales bacterium]